MSGPDSPFHSDSSVFETKNSHIDTPLETVIKADYWANSHYPQMWIAKRLVTTHAALEQVLAGKLLWSDFSTSQLPDVFIEPHMKEKANKAHAAYGQPAIMDRDLNNLWRSDVSDVSNTLWNLLPDKGDPLEIQDVTIAKALKDPKNKQFFESLLGVLAAEKVALESQECLEISKDLRESLRDLHRKKFDRGYSFSLKEQADLRIRWNTISDRLESVLQREISKANQKAKLMLNDSQLEFLTHQIHVGSKVVASTPMESF